MTDDKNDMQIRRIKDEEETQPRTPTLRDLFTDPGVALGAEEEEALNAVLTDLFTDAMGELEVPENDDDMANEIMQREIIRLLERSFLAGIGFAQWTRWNRQHNPDTPDMTIEMEADEAVEIVRGLLSGQGFKLHLLVSRGQD